MRQDEWRNPKYDTLTLHLCISCTQPLDRKTTPDETMFLIAGGLLGKLFGTSG